jgi:hypothetical protein
MKGYHAGAFWQQPVEAVAQCESVGLDHSSWTLHLPHCTFDLQSFDMPH